ncbi:MAG: Ig-like domain-containing protein, partial [Parcubacteria group bacterium]
MLTKIFSKKARGSAKRARRLGTLFVVFATVLWAMGLPFILPVPTALAVSGVAGSDTDTANSGLDGRDFTVTWTPGTAPAGYTDTQIFIFPAAMDPLPTVDNVITNGCNAVACQPRGFFNQYQQPSTTLPQFTTTDSAGATLTAGSYKACVFTNATTDALDCSSAFTVASDTVTDTNTPMIEHMSVSAAQESANAVINAFIIDDQTTEAQFANTGDGQAEYFKLAYGSNLVSAETRVDGASVSGKLFQFTVPSAAVPAAGGAFQYYITAKDRAGNERFFCANPAAATSTACKAAPFIVNTVAAGERTISGTIKQNTSSGTPAVLPSAKIFPGGFAKAAVTAGIEGNAGVYTITGLPNNFPVDVTAYLASYTKNTRMEMVGASNLTNIDINLNAGDLGFYTGGGGGMFSGDMSPHVIFSGPPDNGQNVMLNENIRVGINQPLNSQTVNDSDASNAGSNVYLTSDGTTKIAGTATWCQSNASPGCSALMSMDTNTIFFNPTSDLTANTFYTLVITEAVTSESGQSIAGNRSGGGHRINFTTSAGAAFTGGQLTTNFGSGGQYLPPYVKSTLPAPGNSVAPNVRPLVEFNETMGLVTLISTNIKLVKLPSTPVTSTISVDSTETRFVTLTPATALTAGDYEIQVLGATANARGMTMRTGAENASIAFRTTFTVSGTADVTPPTIYPLVASGGTITVNEGRIEFGFNEPLAAGTVSSSNITLKRGSTAVTANIVYNASENSVYVVPEAALMPNTSYNVTFGTSVTDLAGNALASANTYTYTTGAADTVAPKLKEARCDDYTCTIFFNEPMNHETAADTNYANSVLKQANWTIERVPLVGDAVAIDITGKPTTYNGEDYSVTIQGVSGLAYGNTFRVTASTNIQDLAKNAVSGVSSANILVGATENSQATFGSFGDTGMFGPPVAGVGTMAPPVEGVAGTTVTLGGEFQPQGFGTFTASQFAMGQADTAYPFNPMASQSSNVFQVRFSPGAVLANGDLVELTFPKGTGISNVVEDTFSPYSSDFNEAKGTGTVTYDDTYDTDGIVADTTAMTVTVKLAITGTPGSGDSYTIDLKGITNPSVPKGPESGGYTLGIKVKRGSPAQIVVNKTSMPYFIMAGGSRSITVKVYAGTAGTGTAGATGNIHMWGGGPGGPMDKLVGLTNGITTAADGTAIAADAGIVFTSLPDGCYNFGTEPYVALGGIDYYGQMSP